jgi:hypothetical protein
MNIRRSIIALGLALTTTLAFATSATGRRIGRRR